MRIKWTISHPCGKGKISVGHPDKGYHGAFRDFMSKNNRKFARITREF